MQLSESLNAKISAFVEMPTGERILTVEELISSGLSPAYLKERLGLSRYDLSHYRRLSRTLSPEALVLIDKGRLSLRHARAISRVSRDGQAKFTGDIIQRRWSASRADQQAIALVTGSAPPADAEYYDSIAEQISEQIGHEVKIAQDKANRRSGTITIRYADFDCFDSILARMRVTLNE